MQTRFSRSPARGLYLITPDEPDDGALFAALRTALAARPVLVQYRNKALDRAARARQLERIAPLVRAAGAALVVNDDVERCYEQVHTILRAERLRRSRQTGLIGFVRRMVRKGE